MSDNGCLCFSYSFFPFFCVDKYEKPISKYLSFLLCYITCVYFSLNINKNGKTLVFKIFLFSFMLDDVYLCFIEYKKNGKTFFQNIFLFSFMLYDVCLCFIFQWMRSISYTSAVSALLCWDTRATKSYIFNEFSEQFLFQSTILSKVTEYLLKIIQG